MRVLCRGLKPVFVQAQKMDWTSQSISSKPKPQQPKMVVANVHKIYDHSRVINFISQVQVQNQSGYSVYTFNP